MLQLRRPGQARPSLHASLLSSFSLSAGDIHVRRHRGCQQVCTHSAFTWQRASFLENDTVLPRDGELSGSSVKHVLAMRSCQPAVQSMSSQWGAVRQQRKALPRNAGWCPAEASQGWQHSGAAHSPAALRLHHTARASKCNPNARASECKDFQMQLRMQTETAWRCARIHMPDVVPCCVSRAPPARTRKVATSEGVH